MMKKQIYLLVKKNNLGWIDILYYECLTSHTDNFRLEADVYSKPDWFWICHFQQSDISIVNIIIVLLLCIYI